MEKRPGPARRAAPATCDAHRRLRATCGRGERDLEAVLAHPKLRRWFVAQHFPRVAASASPSPARPRGRGRDDPLVGDTRSSTTWVLHPRLHHVPLGAPRAFSAKLEREAAWLALARGPRPKRRRPADVYVNHKPREYREAIARALRANLRRPLANAYVGKDRLRRRGRAGSFLWSGSPWGPLLQE